MGKLFGLLLMVNLGIFRRLVGGWTNLFEKYARQIRSDWIISPNRGENKNTFEATTEEGNYNNFQTSLIIDCFVARMVYNDSLP